uniref:RING-type domain-containing protein n=1 Tax=Globodera pallida TaxID=36090 RepID=A0A183C8M4_GLOPA
MCGNTLYPPAATMPDETRQAVELPCKCKPSHIGCLALHLRNAGTCPYCRRAARTEDTTATDLWQNLVLVHNQHIQANITAANGIYTGTLGVIVVEDDGRAEGPGQPANFGQPGSPEIIFVGEVVQPVQPDQHGALGQPVEEEFVQDAQHGEPDANNEHGELGQPGAAAVRGAAVSATMQHHHHPYQQRLLPDPSRAGKSGVGEAWVGNVDRVGQYRLNGYETGY